MRNSEKLLALSKELRRQSEALRSQARSRREDSAVLLRGFQVMGLKTHSLLQSR